jgi:hypothetical protein
MLAELRVGVAGDWMVLVASGDPLGPTDQDPDEVRDDACDIVAGGRACEPPPPTNSPEPVEPPTGSGGGGSAVGLGQVLFFAAIVTLVVLLVVLLARRWGSRRVTGAGDDFGDEVAVDEPLSPRIIDHANDPTSWRRRADEHRAAGRIRDALRCRYRALVGDLARRGLLDEIPGRTTGEERAQLGELAPALQPSFGGAADLFDDAWYGDLPVSAADDDRFQELERRVLDDTVRRRR